MAEAKHIEAGPVSIGGMSVRPVFAVGAVLLGSFVANFDSRLFTIALPESRDRFAPEFTRAESEITRVVKEEVAKVHE